MPNDALRMLESDHRKVEALFKETKGAEQAQLEELARSISQELTIHTEIEEKIFYPAVKERAEKEADTKDKLMIGHSYDEHALVKKMLEELAKSRGDKQKTETILWGIEKAVKLHVAEEENVLFPDVRKLFSETELAQLGDSMQQLKTSRRAA